jgi:hypothetical protein
MGGRVEGRLEAAAEGPLGGARVLLYHLATERMFSSSITGDEGRYEVSGLPEGYYDLAVQTQDGLYVADRVVHLDSPGEAALGLTARPFSEGMQRREFPGLNEKPIGVAAVQQSIDESFWGRPAGISVISGAGLMGLLVLANSSGDDESSPAACDDDASPSDPDACP